jgi:L-Lysine epsilon oxidase N-terminal/L-lysine epsilon oxidase C-terminal domain
VSPQSTPRSLTPSPGVEPLVTPDDDPLAAAVRCAIFPSIGVARLGNSPEWFVGPEAPGHGPRPEGGTFKDAAGWVKRQAARFRIYAFGSDGRVLGEVTAANASITWTVHLANKKASFRQFKGRYFRDPPLRNPQTESDRQPDDRASLIIDPGPRQISGVDAGGDAEHRFDSGGIGPLVAPSPKGPSPASAMTARVIVPLGELRTDHLGRLLVLAANGSSGSVLDDNPIKDYANNDYWYDDTADGPVTATVELPSGRLLPMDGRAWCMCVPPHFATEITCITTLWDQMEEIAGLSDRETLSFTHDIWPIFSRVADYQWTNAAALIGHGPDGQASFHDPLVAARLADNSDANRAFRTAIFMRVRDPGLIPDKRIDRGIERYPEAAGAQADGYYMPAMCGDYGLNGPTEADPTTWLTVIPSQYDRLRRWSAGDFENDWPAHGAVGVAGAPALEELPLNDQPDALTRAALERTVGAPFYPGIEMTYIVRDASLYAGPSRFADDLNAGDVTRWMATPWQADFFECNTFWWPSARPDDVVPSSAYLAALLALQGLPGYLLTTDGVDKLRATIPEEVVAALAPIVGVPITSATDAAWAIGQLVGDAAFEQFGSVVLDAMRVSDFVAALGRGDLRRQWARGIGGPQDSPAGDNRMVENWYDLGFVVPVVAPNGQRVHVETERAPTLPETPIGRRGRGGRTVAT